MAAISLGMTQMCHMSDVGGVATRLLAEPGELHASRSDGGLGHLPIDGGLGVSTAGKPLFDSQGRPSRGRPTLVRF